MKDVTITIPGDRVLCVLHAFLMKAESLRVNALQAQLDPDTTPGFIQRLNNEREFFLATYKQISQVVMSLPADG